jgi:hypothetical protein
MRERRRLERRDRRSGRLEQADRSGEALEEPLAHVAEPLRSSQVADLERAFVTRTGRVRRDFRFWTIVTPPRSPSAIAPWLRPGRFVKFGKKSDDWCVRQVGGDF